MEAAEMHGSDFGTCLPSRDECGPEGSRRPNGRLRNIWARIGVSDPFRVDVSCDFLFKRHLILSGEMVKDVAKASCLR